MEVVDDQTHPVQGAQVVHRVAALLRIVAAEGDAGASLADIADGAELTKPTAHRLLSALVAEGLLDRAGRSGRWYLGPEMYVLGSVASIRFSIEELAHPSVQRLAQSTGESAFLSMRRGSGTVCLLREEGSFPVRSFVLTEGVRFPLGTGSAGLAILAHLEDHDREEILAGLDFSDGRYGAKQSLQAIRRTVEEARTTGYVVNPGRIVEGSWGMAAAIFDRAGRPAWALSLTGIESRFRPERQKELGGLLLAEAHRVSTKVRSAAVI